MRNNRNYWPNDDFQADGSPAPGDIRLVPKYIDPNESLFLVLKNPFGPDPIVVSVALATAELDNSVLSVYSVPLTTYSANKYRALPKIRFTVNINILMGCELSREIEIDPEMHHRVWQYLALTKLAEEETYKHPLYIWNEKFQSVQDIELTATIGNHTFTCRGEDILDDSGCQDTLKDVDLLDPLEDDHSNRTEG